jgi:hypothetical protein
MGKFFKYQYEEGAAIETVLPGSKPFKMVRNAK